MSILGIGFALAAGVFFGIIGPVTKTAYNLGAGVGLAIFLRYIVALLIVAPLIPYQKDLIKTCLLYTSPSPRDATLSRMPSSA